MRGIAIRTLGAGALLALLLAPGTALADCVDYANKIRWLSELDTPGQARDLAVSGNRAYIADGPNGLRVVDITNPAAPQSLGFLDTPGTAMSVVVSGTLAYLGDWTLGIRVVDITNPAAPVSVGFVDTWAAGGVALAGQHLVVADYDAGLKMVSVENPASPAVVGSFDTPDLANDVAVSGNFA